MELALAFEAFRASTLTSFQSLTGRVDKSEDRWKEAFNTLQTTIGKFMGEQFGKMKAEVQTTVTGLREDLQRAQEENATLKASLEKMVGETLTEMTTVVEKGFVDITKAAVDEAARHVPPPPEPVEVPEVEPVPTVEQLVAAAKDQFMTTENAAALIAKRVGEIMELHANVEGQGVLRVALEDSKTHERLETLESTQFEQRKLVEQLAEAMDKLVKATAETLDEHGRQVAKQISEIRIPEPQPVVYDDSGLIEDVKKVYVWVEGELKKHSDQIGQAVAKQFSEIRFPEPAPVVVEPAVYNDSSLVKLINELAASVKQDIQAQSQAVEKRISELPAAVHTTTISENPYNDSAIREMTKNAVDTANKVLDELKNTVNKEQIQKFLEQISKDIQDLGSSYDLKLRKARLDAPTIMVKLNEVEAKMNNLVETGASKRDIEEAFVEMQRVYGDASIAAKTLQQEFADTTKTIRELAEEFVGKSMTKDDIEKMVEGFVDGQTLAKQLTEHMAQVQRVVASVKELEVGLEVAEDGSTAALVVKDFDGKERSRAPVALPKFGYRGVYNTKQKYAAGEFVTYEGSVWCAQKDNPGRPHEDYTDWKLAVKAGQKGKDGQHGDNGSSIVMHDEYAGQRFNKGDFLQLHNRLWQAKKAGSLPPPEAAQIRSDDVWSLYGFAQ